MRSLDGGTLSFQHPRIELNRIRFKDGQCQVFDIKEARYRNPTEYTKKQKRLFHRTFSGLQVGYHKQQMLIFLTLTTEYIKEQKKQALEHAEEELNVEWQKLKQLIDYHVQLDRFSTWFHQHFNVDLSTKEGRREWRRQKRYNWQRFKFKLCYLKVRTTEGGGVLHVLIRKNRDIPIIAQKFLKQQWDRIHGAEQVWIEEIKYNPDDGIQKAMQGAFYFCGNYFNQQPVVRQSSSYSWIFKGAAAVWSRGKTILHPKKRLKQTYPSILTEDQYGNEEVHSRLKTDRPYVLWKRPSLIQLFMNSRKSLRKDSGYENALFFWLLLTRNPPVGTRQIKLTRFC